MIKRWLALWRLSRLEKKFKVVRRSDNVVDRLNRVNHLLDVRFLELCDQAKRLVHAVSPEITTDEQAVQCAEIERIEDHRVTPATAGDLWEVALDLQHTAIPDGKADDYIQLECDTSELCAALDTLLALRRKLDPNSSRRPALQPVP